MNIQETHRRAIILAKEAEEYFENDDFEKYHISIKEAFKLEKRAADALRERYESEPTRSVLYRSAAALAYKCGNYADSIDLIIEALKGNPYNEIRLELLELLKSSTSARKRVDDDKEYSAYLESLRLNSINIKLEEKGLKYSGAFVLPHMVEFCKNIQESYKNFAEVHFTKVVKEESTKNYERKLVKFKNQALLLGTDTKFSSFGISISSDKSVMDSFDIHTEEFLNMKRSLFSSFKDDVLLPDYENTDFQKKVIEKYSEEERSKIYGNILKSLTKDYRISLTDETFKNKIKEFKTPTTEVKKALAPKAIINTVPVEQDINLLKKIEQVKGNKRVLISNETVTQLTLTKEFKELVSDKKRVFFNTSHTVEMVYENNLFTIEDSVYGFNVVSKDYTDLVTMYSDKFIAEFVRLLSTSELTEDEKELLDIYESTVMRDW